MAYSRSILTVFATVFGFVFPSFVYAQRVHEVRPSSSYEVRIGTEEGATLVSVLNLARRISGNRELDEDDVVDNNAGVRYVCTAHGRMVYFGNDPTYGGTRCPEDGIRRRGILRNSVYRIPRQHGAILSPPRTTRHPRSGVESNALLTENAELHLQISELTAQLEARVATPVVAPAPVPAPVVVPAPAPPPRVITRTVTVTDPAQAAQIAQLRLEMARLTHERDMALEMVVHPTGLSTLPWWMVVMITLGCTLFLYGVFFRRMTIKPYQEYGAMQAEIAEEKSKALKNADRVMKEESKRIVKLERSRKRLAQRIVELMKLRDETVPSLKRLEAFEDRREHLLERNRRIIQLREQEEMHDRYLRQIAEAEEYLTAQHEPDEVLTALCQATIETCRKELSRIPFDLEEIRKDLRSQVSRQGFDLQEHCGYPFGGDASDEWKAEWEADARRKSALAESKRLMFEDLLRQQREAFENERLNLALGNERELAATKLKLENSYAAKDGALAGKLMLHGLDAQTAREDAKQSDRAAVRVRVQLNEAQERLTFLMQEVKELRQREASLLQGEESYRATAELIISYDQQIADLKKQLLDLANNRLEEPLATDETGMFARPERMRRVTGAIDRSTLDAPRVSIPSTPPLRKETPILIELFEYLEHFTTRKNGSESPEMLLTCSELEARDLLYFLHNFFVQSPLLAKPVLLRKFAIAVEKVRPELLAERLRRKTDPPGAPVPT